MPKPIEPLSPSPSPTRTLVRLLGFAFVFLMAFALRLSNENDPRPGLKLVVLLPYFLFAAFVVWAIQRWQRYRFSWLGELVLMLAVTAVTVSISAVVHRR